jgi:hypothetical protein
VSGPHGGHGRLSEATDGAGGALTAADELCRRCVEELNIDGASISLMYEGSTRGTFGSSGPVSRRLDELQFTYGEGPCLDAVAGGEPVLVPDLDDPIEQRWPALREALLGSGISAVFAFPISMASTLVGALDLFRHHAGPLSEKDVAGGRRAADLAATPLLDLMTADVDWDDAAQGASRDWAFLAPLERVEVYQATGMLISALDIAADEALIRLRAYAFTHGMTASDTAWAIVNRTLPLDTVAWQRGNGTGHGD